MEELEAAENSVVVIRNLEELQACYRILRGLIREHKKTVIEHNIYNHLEQLEHYIIDDLSWTPVVLRENMEDTVKFSRQYLIPAKNDETTEHYLQEIEVLIASYDKHGKGESDV